MKKGYFPVFLAAVALGMLIYEITCCNEFIAYIDGYYTYKYLPDFIIEQNFDYYVKFPVGTAICELPFFLAAHIITLLVDPGNATGFGGAYESAIGICGIFYFCLGFSFLYATIKRIYDDRIAFISCGCLMLGTPVIYYGTKYAAFSHIYTFAVSAIFLYLTETIDESRFQGVKSFLMGISAGMLFLIRNVNVLFVMVYILMYFGVKGEYREHIKRMFSRERLSLNITGALLTIAPQLLHWRRVLGSWLPNTYSDESFTYATAPKVFQVWFSDAKGYFIFAPIMILSVLGFFCMYRTKGRRYLAGSLAVFLYETYITSAWWCWWMGGVYSIRSFIDITAFMAIPMGAFFLRVRESCHGKKKVAVSLVTAGVLAICIYTNFALLRGAEVGIINETLASWWQLKQSMLLGQGTL